MAGVGVSGASGTGCVAMLDILSGRPNPEWTLTAAQCAEAEARLGKLGTTTSRAPAMPGLGYRGIVLRVGGGEWRVYAGQARRRGKGGAADAGRAFERWLLATAEGQLPAELIDAARQEIGPG